MLRARFFSASSPVWVYALLLVVLCYVAALLGASATVEARPVLLRYWSLLGAATLAMAPPHVLYPDSRVPLLQLLNRSPAQLLVYQAGRWAPVGGLFVVSAVLIAFVDPDGYERDLLAKSTWLVEYLLIIVGAGAYSFVRYATLGARSQAWQEDRSGRWYANWVEMTGQGFSVPRGLVPALFVTAHSFTVALAAVIAAAYLEPRAAGLAAWGPGAMLCAVAAVRIRSTRVVYDRYFYHTNAFYREVLGGGGAHVQARAPVAYDATYWVPHRWRPAVWASLRQFDRVLPLGRLIALGHLVLWMLFLQGAGSAIIASYLFLFIVAQNAASYVLSARATAPLAFQITHQSPFDWAMTRFFVNLRWVLSFALSLLVVAFFDRTFSLVDVLFWTGLDVLVAFTSAALVTWTHEGTARRQYA